MTELTGKFQLIETCEVTKNSAVGHKSQNMFLHLGTKDTISASNPGDVLLKGSIYLRVWKVISKIPSSK